MKLWVATMPILFIVATGLPMTIPAQGPGAQVAEAERLYEQALKLYGAARYSEAISVAERGLGVIEKEHGREHPTAGPMMTLLAALYEATLDYPKAEQFYLRVMVMYMGALGQEHTLVASAATGLASFWMNIGKFEEAEILFRRALAIYEKASGPESLDVATALGNLAALYAVRSDFAKAVPLMERAFVIYYKVLGPEHRLVALMAINLANDYSAIGQYAKAEPILQRVLVILENQLGKEHDNVASALDSLAQVYMDMGSYAKAETAYQRALAIHEKAWGTLSPHLTATLANLAGLYEKINDPGRALSMQSRLSEIEEYEIGLCLTYGSEQKKQGYLDSRLGDFSREVSLHTRRLPGNLQAARLALTAIMRRKGRALDAMTDQIGTLRRRASPQDAGLFERLITTRTELANLQLDPPERLSAVQRREKVIGLEAVIGSLEDEISRRSAEFRTQRQPVTVERVQHAIPNDAALVELFIHRPVGVKTAQPDAARSVAYVLHRTSGPTFVDLGEASTIEAAVARFREALQTPNRTDVKQVGRLLDEQVMRPIRKLLGPTRRILLSPDGALNLIPFAALVDENGQYLVENYSITYLTSGRDLLRLQVQTESRSTPLVMADPLYDLTAVSRPRRVGSEVNPPGGQTESKRRSMDFTLKSYAPLPGTAAEAAALAKLLPQGTRVLVQEQATEAALKQVDRPLVLHVATHGFFLPDQAQAVGAGNKPLRGTSDTRGKSRLPARWENPLLRSGLILAGVKQGQSGVGEDGVLTALEVAGLDLWGTKLVVLSACETGLGEVANAVGVYGLRRALVLAGSETQVMSLWKVSDAGTSDLMVAYYTRLQAGEGRTDALRQVQLAMLRGQLTPTTASRSGKRETSDSAADDPSAYRHPYYWASFIPSGNWRDMNGKDVRSQ
jgi:CHAT domain-containing protein